jgi:polyisoprenoid-binding protein YceI
VIPGVGTILVALAATLGAATVAAQETTPIRAGTVREGVLSFDGKATAGDFTGTTHTVTGSLTAAPTLAGVTGFVEAPVNTLVTGNGRRDRDLNKSMESDSFPALRFQLDGVDSIQAGSDSTLAHLRGQLVIHGITRPVNLPAVLFFAADGVKVRSTFPLNLKDYKIGGLSKMLGMLKMHPDIVVHVDVTFAY